ncbi:DUF1761 domain-containing protein [Mucilaginibacter sp. RB4R14]|uniref:DUF1761 domain-containing protein n=1 Tax=Mucilaginibacter aurantiaciroseus TaxID=2949308 RepID=UPI002090B242|nr:DUF1761 domain-containing protein [Mucilaginibacter aurantiaciroseus]MCO5934504.1 DUF1761 domain-containing protein [Mucilaginibacter aurantiaciroseus]
MDASLIYWPAVAVAGLSGFAVGGIWYAPPVFGKAWMADSNNRTVTKRQKSEDLWFHVLFIADNDGKPRGFFGQC